MHGGTLLCMWMYTEEEHHCYLVASLATFQLEVVSYCIAIIVTKKIFTKKSRVLS